MVSLGWKHVVDMLEPFAGFCGNAGDDRWWMVKVEARDTGPFDPAAFDDQLFRDDHRQSRSPGHLLDWFEPVEPGTGGQDHLLAVFVEDGGTFIVGELDWRNSRIDARSRPGRAGRREDVVMHRHEGIEIVEGYAIAMSRCGCSAFPDAMKLPHAIGHALLADPGSRFGIAVQRLAHFGE